jgi:hypothetical protein
MEEENTNLTKNNTNNYLQTSKDLYKMLNVFPEQEKLQIVEYLTYHLKK